MSDREELQITQSFANRLLLEENTKLKADLELAREKIEEFELMREDRDMFQAQLQKAEKVVEFYSKHNTSWENEKVIPQDRELVFYANGSGFNTGGKKARQYFRDKDQE